jgi:hypothetical protein
MNQKKKLIDLEDYEHSKFIPYCKYFVTNDKHFSKRLKASITELEIQTKLLTLNEFLEEIKKIIIKNQIDSYKSDKVSLLFSFSSNSSFLVVKTRDVHLFN